MYRRRKPTSDWLNCKKNRKAVKADYLRIGAVNGLGVKETLLLPVGVVFDLLESYARAHRPPARHIKHRP